LTNWQQPPTSKDKSLLKGVLREAPFADAIACLESGERHQQAATMLTFFVDAAIQMSSLSAKMTGLDVLSLFARLLDSLFSIECPNAHTGVLCFDDKTCVPARKAAMQASRREALLTTIARKRVPEWTWDGESPIIEPSRRSLPPWERVRLDSAAYARAQRDIIDWLLAAYVPPPGRRLVIDSVDGLEVLETTPGGDTLEPYADVTPKPAIGEADISAQYWIRRGHLSSSALGDPECVLVTRSHVKQPAEHARYYDAETWRRVSSTTNATVAHARRRDYPGGDVLLRTTDTDFISLGLVEQVRPRDTRHGVFVSLGAASLDEHNNYCTSANGRTVTEVYDLASLVRAINRVAPTIADDVDALASHLNVWSFVAFCISCGNDYTKRLPGFSHASMFAAYRDLDRRLVTDVLTTPVLDASAFAEYIRIACHRKSATLPSREIVEAYYDQVLWSLTYAEVGVRGEQYIPQ
jgi:hypothetical protein